MQEGSDQATLARAEDGPSGPLALALVAIPEDRRGELEEWLKSEGAQVISANNFREARKILNTGRPFRVVFTALSFEDGNWWSISQEVGRAYLTADVVVCAPEGVEEASLLAHGADAVLLEPLSEARARQNYREALRRSQARARLAGC